MHFGNLAIKSGRSVRRGLTVAAGAAAFLLAAGVLTALALGYAGTTHLLARVAIPSSGVLGASDTVTVTATSRFNAAAGDVVRDRVDIPTDPAVLSLTEQVDRTTAIAGDLLTYRVNYDV